MAETERTLAVFIDFENLAIGFKHRRGEFDIHKILERLVEKGKVIVKKAYADWGEYKQYTRPLHENAIELIEIPRRQMTGKNSADIRLAVDAMDLAWSKEHIDTFVIVSGDSDFSPLVSKLKENGKHVIGIGMKASTSDLLSGNCDEFIFYEDLEKQPAPAAPRPAGGRHPAGEERGLRPAARVHRAPSSGRTRTPSSPPWSKTPCSARSPRSTSRPTATAASATC